VSATQVPLPAHTAVLIGLVAFGAVAFDVTWFLVRYVTVMAHEGAHAVAMSLLFRGVEGIRLRARRAEGGTTPKKGGARLGTSSIAFVGYLGPSAFGLGAAKLIELGDIAVMLWGALFLLGILLLALRWSFGLVFLIARCTPMQTQVVAAYAIAWLLLVSGVRRIVEVGIESDDGKLLTGLTFIPRLIWSLLWLAGSIAAVVVGGKLLVMGT
jgi:peptidase M50B-like protein